MNEIPPVATKWIVLKGHWRESLKGIQAGALSHNLSPENCMQLCSFLFSRNCFWEQRVFKEQRVLAKLHTKEENNILDPLKLNVPWYPITSYFWTLVLSSVLTRSSTSWLLPRHLYIVSLLATSHTIWMRYLPPEKLFIQNIFPGHLWI